MVDGSMSILDSLLQQQANLQYSLQMQIQMANLQATSMIASQFEPCNNYHVGDYYTYNNELRRVLAEGASCRILFEKHPYCCEDRRPTPSHTNCVNCGAPLGYHFRCEYCGTVNN